jgi:hypothetical protein
VEQLVSQNFHPVPIGTVEQLDELPAPDIAMHVRISVAIFRQ